jgi:formylmethanofuran dehydrogenase subunit D
MDDSIGNPLESTGTPLAPGTRRFLMNAGRTTKQGQQVSSGKFLDDYKATVSTMIMHAGDMKDIGVPNGSTVRVRSLWGEETFKCIEGKTPSGMIFIPYGPPTCRLMGQYTDGTGMPLSKGWEVEVELLEAPPSGSVPAATEAAAAEPAGTEE